MELQGQSAIVTGAGRGIGRATALELARMGADIVVAELDKPGAERTAGEVTALGRRALAVPTDVTRPADLTAMIERTRAAFGRLEQCRDLPGRFDASDHGGSLGHGADHQRQGGLLRQPGRAADHDRAEERGDRQPGIDGGQDRQRQQPSYNASKAAVISITKSLALAHAADGIRVNCVCPGFVETDMWTSVSKELGALTGVPPAEFTRRRLATIPLGRMERPEDVANVIGFLASTKAGYMTGQALSVDGGLVMH